MILRICSAVTLWDLPGHSTPKFPLDTYLRDMGLRYFDAIIMVTQDVFSEGDVKLVNEMNEHEVPYIMVTKIKILEISIVH